MNKKNLKQIGGTCGYFAFINSLIMLFPEINFSYKDVYFLLKKAVSLKITYIGEMFKYPPNDLFEEYIKKLNLPVKFEKKDIDFLKEDLESLKEDEAVIISIPSGKTNSHWIGIVRLNGKLLIIDSNKRKLKKCKYKKVEKEHKQLLNRAFDFKSYFNFKYYFHRFNRYIRFIYIKFIYKDKYADAVYKLVKQLENDAKKNIPDKIEIECGSYYFLKKIIV